MSKRRILITSGLPYANGPIHLGHMVEAIQTDIFARAMRMQGHEAHYFCADDTHGTPIEINASKQGISPEELIARSYESHRRDFAGFEIEFACYHTTHSPENQSLANAFFAKLQEAKLIEERVVKQLYSLKAERFLPDRYVKGTCPKCKATEQYGDTCESCKARYDAIELIDPISVIDGSQPVVRESKHLFVNLASSSEDLRRFAESDALSPEIRNFVLGWIDEGLQSWNISRDKPYFGFEIPGYPDKFYYVWMDAPIGYMATTEAWCQREGKKLEDYWRDPKAEIWHFIGKDIIYFHCLFWPVMLKAAGYQLPKRIHAHGFLTVNGKKMSKSRGTFILAEQYLKALPAAYLRYYFAAKLSNGVEDLDLNIEDFYYRVRSELVDNLANLHNRSFSFAESKLDGKLSNAHYTEACRKLIAEAKDKLRQALEGYERLDTAFVVRKIAEIGDSANLFYQEQAPWASLKIAGEGPDKARAIVTACIEVVRLIAIGLKPIVPDFSEKIFKQLGLPELNVADIDDEVDGGVRVTEVEKLYIRPEREEFDAITQVKDDSMNEEQKSENTSTLPGEENGEKTTEIAIELRPLKEAIAYADFEKLDIRIGKILACERVKKSNKLFCCQVDFGDPSGPVQIVSGLALHYQAEALIDRFVLVLCNLEPRTIFGLESRGMILAASDAAGLELPGTLLRQIGATIS